jgi:hypothetical protein
MSNLSPKYTPRTYAEARSILDNAGKSAIPLCYETRLVQGMFGGAPGVTIAIQHHSTAIVVFRPDGSIRLDGRGWASRTTADRMHRFTPQNVRVNNRKGTLTVTVDDVVVGDATYGITINA